MPKQKWKPGNMLYPLPAVLVSCGDKSGKINVMTAAWTGTICSDPAMVYVSIRKSRYSHHMICETGEYCINLTTEALARAADFAGVRSGRDMDKFKELHLTPVFGTLKYAPMIDESPVCIECRVEKILELGSHDMFMARVEAVYADEKYKKAVLTWKNPNLWCIPTASITAPENALESLVMQSKRKSRPKSSRPKNTKIQTCPLAARRQKGSPESIPAFRGCPFLQFQYTNCKAIRVLRPLSGPLIILSALKAPESSLHSQAFQGEQTCSSYSFPHPADRKDSRQGYCR